MIVEGLRGRIAGVSSSEHLSIRGLLEGDYRVVPVYQGGIRGRPLAASIRRGSSTVLLLPYESLGEAHLQLAPEYCNSGAQLHVQAFGNGPDRLQAVESCDTRLGGLRPGSYRVTLRDASMAVGPVSFIVRAQQVVSVAFPSPDISVSGRVTASGRPIEGATVTYLGNGSDAVSGVRRVEAQTDSTGFYRAVLNRAGAYRYQVSHRRAGLTARGQMMIREGANRGDIALAGGTVRVTVLGLRERARVTLRLEDERDRSFGSYEMSWEKGSSWQPVFEAVPTGRYKLTVRAYGLPPSFADEIAVELTPSTQDIEVSLNMKTAK